MAIFKLAISTLLIILMMSNPALAGNSKCPFVANEVVIRKWDQPLPSKIKFTRYEKGTKFEKKLQTSTNSISQELIKYPENKYPYLIIKITDYPEFGLPIDYDYKLTINESIEVNFYEIQTSRPNLGCQILKAKANDCEVGFGGGHLMTQASCLREVEVR